MLKYILFLLACIESLNAQTIDKKKILEIIKSAKLHKTVKIDKSTKVSKNFTKPESESIIVYRKRKKVPWKKIDYGTLPTLVPSSVELQRKFKMEEKSKQVETLFKSPQQNKNKKINTTAIKIKYF